MKKIMLLLSLSLSLVVLVATGALALTAEHSYTVQLSTVSASGQHTAVEQLTAMSDSDGKLSFHFSDVPDTGTAPFLMVQIMDTVGGQQQVVRQALVPAPAAGQQLQTGVNELSSRQAQAGLLAMQAGTGQALGAMFSLLMIPTGAIAAADVENVGYATADAATTFQAYLRQNGVTDMQISGLQDGLLEGMREFSATSKSAVDQSDPVIAAGLWGQAGTRLMSAIFQAGAAADIDPALLSAAFDRSGQAIDASSALNSLPVAELDTLQTSFLVDAQMRRLMAQVRGYALAMPVVGASGEQTLAVTAAMDTLQSSMLQARQHFFQQAFANQDYLPDSTRLNQALSEMEPAMENAFAVFDQATTASDAQITSMLDNMAGYMSGSGGMMGGGMMSGSTLEQMGFGMMRTGLDGTSQNWSTMMLAANNLASTMPEMVYTPAAAALTDQLAAENLPAAPDWSQLADGPDKSLLQLQYDLMLVHLIDLQTVAGMSLPLEQADLASLSSLNLANRNIVRQGLQGLSAAQKDAMIASFSIPWLCPLY